MEPVSCSPLLLPGASPGWDVQGAALPGYVFQLRCAPSPGERAKDSEEKGNN